MNTLQKTKFEKIFLSLNMLSVYRGLVKNPIVSRFIELSKLMCSVENDFESLNKIISLYSEICEILYNSKFDSNLSSYIYNAILYDENKFSIECFCSNKIEENLFNAAQNDYKILMLLAGLTSEEVIELIKNKFCSYSDLLLNLPTYKHNPEIKKNPPIFEKIMCFYRKNSFGSFAFYTTFKFDKDLVLKPSINHDNIKLADLKLYQMQKNLFIQNVQAFIENKPNLNTILYGDRGCGKSSTVKAVLNEFSQKNLRLIQVQKDNLSNLSILFSKLSGYPLKFIIFIDDLSFNENDGDFSTLKAMLEGSIEKQPQNIMICVTSNRRHLIKESFKARQGDELHLSDTIDETLSLADRFGLVINYNSPRKDDYLEIVKLLAKDKLLQIDELALVQGAEAWALEKAARSPRIASQYIEFLQSTQ